MKVIKDNYDEFVVEVSLEDINILREGISKMMMDKDSSDLVPFALVRIVRLISIDSLWMTSSPKTYHKQSYNALNELYALGGGNAPRKATVKDVTISRKHMGSRMHLFTVPFGISKQDACALQMELGYHPAGYGFYSFDATLTGTTWKCGDSCD